MPRPSTAAAATARAGFTLCAALALGATARVGAEDDPGTAAAVATAGSGPLVATIEVERLRVDAGPDGTEVRRFVDARRIDVGEQIYYTIRVRNPGRAPVRDIVVTKRLPYGVEYVPGSAVGPDCRAELSADGGRHYVSSAVAGAAYTHLRWTCGQPLAPGATSLLRFRAIFR
jgi:uncharacterized repeat protein (TIGR01451 family)